MKVLIQKLRELELGRAGLASASPADLFDLEAALVFALAEVKKRRGEAPPANEESGPSARGASNG